MGERSLSGDRRNVNYDDPLGSRGERGLVRAHTPTAALSGTSNRFPRRRRSAGPVPTGTPPYRAVNPREFNRRLIIQSKF
ncbi:hypothetical protein J6590_035407 [Homalodisca vitripennis]|nr:hypothetical protein J6590_035407 [Homalodisca vitripennis]